MISYCHNSPYSQNKFRSTYRCFIGLYMFKTSMLIGLYGTIHQCIKCISDLCEPTHQCFLGLYGTTHQCILGLYGTTHQSFLGLYGTTHQCILGLYGTTHQYFLGLYMTIHQCFSIYGTNCSFICSLQGISNILWFYHKENS